MGNGNLGKFGTEDELPLTIPAVATIIEALREASKDRETAYLLARLTRSTDEVEQTAALLRAIADTARHV